MVKTMNDAHDLREAALLCHERLTPRLRCYLNERGIQDDVIDKHLLGWNGQRITIPITDREGMVVFFKLAKDPADTSASPKMLCTPGTRAELYGWEQVLARPERIIICEGEFDRLVLESQGFAAVTSTAGAITFRREWSAYFAAIPSVYICFDHDEAGGYGAHRVAQMIPHAQLVQLPDDVGDAGDITDFFVRLGSSLDDFKRLLDTAQPQAPEVPVDAQVQPPHTYPPGDPAIQELKSRIGITDLVGRYVAVTSRGERALARCPFHDDRTPSFVLYPETGTFFCFGCRAHGDVIAFLMRIEKLSFRQAVDALQNFSN
jgi:DNA primase